MTQPFLFTSEQANTLNTTGHLDGFNELSDWQPPKGSRLFGIIAYQNCWIIEYASPGVKTIERKRVDPTRAVGQVYACKEPWQTIDNNHEGLTTLYEADADYDGWIEYQPAKDMDDCDVRLHAKIATEPTPIIHEGKLVWTYDLVKE